MAQNINKNWEYTIKNQLEFIEKCIDNSIEYAMGKKEPLMRALEQSGPDAYFEREIEKFADRAAALAAYKAVIIKATADAYGIGASAASKPVSEMSPIRQKTAEEKQRQIANLAKANRKTDDTETDDAPWA